jgi:alkane 1-monooxygenase
MRLVDLRFLAAWLLPVSALLCLALRPAWAGLLGLALWWGIAALDAGVPGAQRSPEPVPPESGLAYFRWVLRAYVPLQLGLIALGATLAPQLGLWQLLGVAFLVGFISGSQGITYAHELGHSKFTFDRFCAWVLMGSVCYSHFMVEHYRGHHPRAATFDDPASARYGESLYRFLPRTLWGSWVSAWRLERQRLRQLQRSWLRSPLVVCWGVVLGLFMLIVHVFTAQAAIKIIVFLLLQSVIAFLLLEVVNYIEHYGLQRHAVGSRREAFAMQHAWNADHAVTNSLLANLQRHSDHHMHAWKPYATLEALPGPQLPTGYAGCILLAMLPPLWFRLMHPRIAALQNRPLEGVVMR